VTTLILLRHAKSDWHGGDPDRDRPLSPRGRRAAATIGRFLARLGELPDAALTSPATRARETLRLAMDAGGWTCPTRESERLYHDGVDGLLAEVNTEASSTRLLLAVGHEPTWSEAVAVLTGGTEVRMPTAAAACIDFGDTPWSQVGGGSGVLGWLVTPRLIERL
jgi:phosphohistidine phosphatase